MYSRGTTPPLVSSANWKPLPAGNGSSVTVTTNNTLTRDVGSLLLKKELTGGPDGYDGPFTIHWDCGTAGSGNEDLTAGADAVEVADDIPTGTECTISEPTLPTVPNYTFGTPSFSPSETVIVSVPSAKASSRVEMLKVTEV